MPKARSHTKRKAGHIGFQANEIAFIEDEMAALAAEYGLNVDQEIAAHVSHRRDHKKKARLRRLDDATIPTAATNASTTADQSTRSVVRLLAPARRRMVVRKDFDGDHDLVHKILRNVLPEGVTLAQCDVPGCGCTRGHRELSLHDQEETVATERDVISRGVCKKCHHGVLQHALVVADDAASGGFQRLLGTLFQLVRTGRLAGTVFRSRVWVASILRLLTAQLARLKHQIAAGGTQNGQKTLPELQQEQIVLGELTALLKKAEHASQKAVARDALAIEWANALDPMYFRLYYACIAVYGRACAAVPPPDIYFGDLESFTPEVHAMVEAFVNQELIVRDDETMSPLVQSLALPLVTAAMSNRKKKELIVNGGTSTSTGSGMALLDIYHLRFREGIRLFYEQSIGMHGDMDAVLSNAGGVLTGGTTATASSSASKKKPHRRDKEASSAKDSTISLSSPSPSRLVDMPAYELLAQWRNNCRDWCCHLYAYATPTDDALAVLAKYAPLVEMGAGTGYWASLLAARGVDIMAFDICPPSLQTSSYAESDEADRPFAHLKKKPTPSSDPTQNAYHGDVPTFTSVAKGGPETLTTDVDTFNKRTLFLCYPPPHDDMARRSLRCFKGEFVVYVGEWQGDTADRTFEKELVNKFTSVDEVALPNWGNSAYSLTVWQRKKRTERGHHAPSILNRLSCFHCHASLLDAMTDDDAAEFKRCVLCKTHVYCSEDCSTAHSRRHAAEHAMRLVFLEDDAKLDFENDLHYKPMEAMATEEGEEEEDSEEEEEKGKVVVAKTNWKALTTGKAAAVEETTKTSGGFAFNFGSS